MVRSLQKAAIRDFSKGLYSDLTELNTPSGVSVDEDNCTIERTGSRRRRPGLDKETDGTAYGGLTDAEAQTIWFQDYEWKSVAGVGGLSFIVLQVGSTLYFYNAGSEIISAGRKSFTVNLATYKTVASSGTSLSGVSMTVVKGALFVVGAEIEPFYVVYDPDADTVSVTLVSMKIRDFKQQNTSVDLDATPVSTYTATLEYDLLNQGWYTSGVLYYRGQADHKGPLNFGETILSAYKRFESKYPTRNGSWYLGKGILNGATAPYPQFSYDQRATELRGNALAPLGHYLLDPFRKDRSSVSGAVGIAVEVEYERPVACSSMAGRVFYGLKNTVYYSQILENDLTVAGKCYQVADPTNEDDSSLAATDGGVVTILEIGRIVAMATTRGSLIVFATNGVWTISGSQGAGFSATGYSVSKISGSGIQTGRSIVDVEGTPFWWTSDAIYSLKSSEIDPSLYTTVNIIDKRLMTYFNNIPMSSKQYVKGAYNPSTKVLSWAFRSMENSTSLQYDRFQYDKILNYSFIFDAFYPYSFDTTNNGTTTTPYTFISGILNVQPYDFPTEEHSVTKADGTLVLNSADVQVVADAAALNAIPITTKFWVMDLDVTNDWSFGYLGDTDYVDFTSYVTSGLAYTSYLNAFYHMSDDNMTYLQAPFVFVFSKNTDTAASPSSLYMQARWEWANSVTANKYSTATQVYKHRLLVMSEEDSPTTMATGFPVIVTRNKIRGKGRALQLRFYSESGYDFELLGWSLETSKQDTP